MQRMRYRIVLFSAWVVVLIVLQGCGGGGGGGTPISPPNGVLRIIRVGDMWTYDVRGTFTNLETGEKISVKGTLRNDIEPTDINGVLASKITLNLTANGRPLTIVGYSLISQDINGTIRLHGMVTDSGLVSLQEPIISRLSPMTIGQLVDYSGIFTSGEVIIGSYRVDTIEQISVPAGKFIAFKVIESSIVKDKFGNSEYYESSTMWIVPQIGIVYEKSDVTVPLESYSYSITASLKTYQLNP